MRSTGSHGVVSFPVTTTWPPAAIVSVTVSCSFEEPPTDQTRKNLKPTSGFASHVAELYKQHLGDNHRALWGRRWRGWRCRGHGRAGEKKAQLIKPSGTANAWLARAALAGVEPAQPEKPASRQTKNSVCHVSTMRNEARA